MCDWQLGDWVEFDVIVGKAHTPTGTEPAAVTLNRVRRGMVVGKRKVYDVQAGAPPLLHNPRPVLLIAVSLGRFYRVFPGDMRPSSPPKSRRQRAAAVAPAPGSRQPAMVGPPSSQSVQAMVQTVLATHGRHGRATLTTEQLELLVASEINQMLTAGQWFTAYAVTLRLRATFPSLDFNHSELRPMVHAQMEAMIAAGLYDRENATYGSAMALRYVPL